MKKGIKFALICDYFIKILCQTARSKKLFGKYL